MEITQEMKKALSKAKIDLVMKSTFVSTMLFSMRFRWDWTQPTAYVALTNPVTMGINPMFFMELTKGARVTLLAHEVWHIGLMHFERKGERDMGVLNEAGDHVINNMLKKAGYEPIPGWLCDEKFADWTTEEVYDYLMANPEEQVGNSDNQCVGSGRGENGEGQDADGIEGQGAGGKPKLMDPKEAKKVVTGNMVKAMEASKASREGAGNMPAGVRKMLEEIICPPLDWRTVLEQYSSERIKDDYGWQRPNRRYMQTAYLPSLDGEGIGDIMCMCDASGSVSDEDFAKLIAQIRHIKEMVNPSKVEVTTWTTKIETIQEFSREESMDDLTLGGSGGTCITPVLERIKEKQPSLAIIFTDGQFSSCDVDPGVDIIWLIKGNYSEFKWDFGTVIEYKD